MTAITDALREEHRNIARLLDVLEHQVDVFARAGDPDYDVIRGIAEYFLDFPDRCHHPKEDVIFRRLKEAHPEPASPIGDLEAEHRRVHERAERLGRDVSALLGQSDIARSAVVEAAAAFIESERKHMRMEEELFFPLAERLLAPEAWTEIQAQLAVGRDPIFGGKTEARFKELSLRLIAWHEDGRQGAR